MRKVSIVVDGERAAGDLLTAPSAIGVVEVRVRDVVYSRYVGRVEPLDDGARELLASGDRFVARDPVEVVAASDPVGPAPEVWTIDHLEKVRLHAISLKNEHERWRRDRDRGRRLRDVAVALSLVNRWIKEARMARTAAEAGVASEVARDPLALLELARREILRLNKRLSEVGEDQPYEAKRIASVINDYLQHHSPARDPRRT